MYTFTEELPNGLLLSNSQEIC